MRKLHFDHAASKIYCESLGLVWLGDAWIETADADAWVFGFSQEQVDAAMRHHLWQVAWLFNPKNYSWKYRLLVAFYFITGWKPK